MAIKWIHFIHFEIGDLDMKRMDGSTKNVKVMSKLGEKNKSFQGVKFWLVSIVMFLLANSLSTL